MHLRTEGLNGLHDDSIVFDIPDHIWKQLNQGKELKAAEMSGLSQPMSYCLVCPANRGPVVQQQHELLVILSRSRPRSEIKT